MTPKESGSAITVVGDPVEWVQKHPERFCRAGTFDAVEAATDIAAEVLVFGAESVTVYREGEWWIVRSPDDWLPTPLDRDAFMAIVAFPEAGLNACRMEIVLTAFAGDVATCLNEDCSVIRGDLPTEVRSSLRKKSGRAVAFRP